MNPQQFLQVHNHNNERDNRFTGCSEFGHDAIHPEPSLALAKLAFDSVTDSLIFAVFVVCVQRSLQDLLEGVPRVLHLGESHAPCTLISREKYNDERNIFIK